MATRDRTTAFNKIKDELKNTGHKAPRYSFEADNDHGDTSSVQLVPLKSNNNNIQGAFANQHVLPQWMHQITIIDSNISRIKLLLEKLSDTHSANTLPSFDGSFQSNQERDIQHLTAEISSLFKNTHQYVKNLGNGVKLVGEPEKIKNNIQASKSQTLHDLTLIFRQKQKTYLNQLQRRNNNFHDWAGDGEEDEDLIEEQFDFTLQQKQVVNHMDLQAKQRHDEIAKIVKAVNELSTLFNDINTLVVEQGTLLDQIENNMNQIEDNLIVADTEVSETNRLHKEYRSRLCILLVLVALVVTMIFVVIIKALI